MHHAQKFSREAAIDSFTSRETSNVRVTACFGALYGLEQPSKSPWESWQLQLQEQHQCEDTCNHRP